MAQRLRMMIKKDGSAKGVAIAKTKATKNKGILKTLFQMAFQENEKAKKKNGKSKNKASKKVA